MDSFFEIHSARPWLAEDCSFVDRLVLGALICFSVIFLAGWISRVNLEKTIARLLVAVVNTAAPTAISFLGSAAIDQSDSPPPNPPAAIAWSAPPNLTSATTTQATARSFTLPPIPAQWSWERTSAPAQRQVPDLPELTAGELLSVREFLKHYKTRAERAALRQKELDDAAAKHTSELRVAAAAAEIRPQQPCQPPRLPLSSPTGYAEAHAKFRTTFRPYGQPNLFSESASYHCRPGNLYADLSGVGWPGIYNPVPQLVPIPEQLVNGVQECTALLQKPKLNDAAGVAPYDSTTTCGGPEIAPIRPAAEIPPPAPAQPARAPSPVPTIRNPPAAPVLPPVDKGKAPALGDLPSTATTLGKSPAALVVGTGPLAPVPKKPEPTSAPVKPPQQSSGPPALGNTAPPSGPVNLLSNLTVAQAKTEIKRHMNHAHIHLDKVRTNGNARGASRAWNDAVGNQGNRTTINIIKKRLNDMCGWATGTDGLVDTQKLPRDEWEHHELSKAELDDLVNLCTMGKTHVKNNRDGLAAMTACLKAAERAQGLFQ